MLTNEGVRMNPQIEALFDKETWTFTYIVHAGEGSACVIIDSVLDYDPKAGRTATISADRVVSFVQQKKLKSTFILETHAHADHISAAQYLKRALGGQTVIGSHIVSVQKVFKDIFNLESTFETNGHQFDKLIQEGETLRFGDLELEAISVPGHTPACMAYKVGDTIFVGDTMFMPDVGSARCDFPGGDAHSLYRSVQKLLSYPAETKLFMCHDYPPDGRSVQCQTTVGQQRARNIHLMDGVNEQAFVTMRTARDATLEMPVLILPAVQINIRAGNFPPVENNGVAYLKIPVNLL